MNKGRTFMTIGAGLAVSAALAACGGGGSGGGGRAKAPSALDPANMVPATAVAYADVTIRPQGSIRSDLVEAINSIAGRGTAQELSAKWARSEPSFERIKPWLGQRMGLALTALPASVTQMQAIKNYVLLVIPSNDPAAARKALLKRSTSSWETTKIEGHYLLAGGKAAVAAAAATASKTSLAADPGFKSDMSQLGGAELVRAYVPLHELYQQLLPLLRHLPQYSQTSALDAGAKQAPPGSSLAVGMSAPRNQFRLDLVEQGTPHTNAPPTGVATDVSSLPASSWLAMTLGGALTKSGTVGKLAASVSKSLATLQATQGLTQRSIPNGPLQFIVRDLLPALGPAELSVSGSSSTTLQAGLVMDPVNKRAGSRLAAAVKHMVAGLPVSATTTGGRVAVTFGFSNLQQLLNPTAKLGSNPAFKRALGQLPAGGKADLYLSFSGIATLAALDPNAATGSTMKILRRLDYLIAGGTHSHFRLVLTTH